MKFYKLEYAYDMYMDGRMAGGTHLFSTLDKLFLFTELEYGKKREDFEDQGNGNYYAENDVDEWDTETWYVTEVALDEDLDRVLEREKAMKTLYKIALYTTGKTLFYNEDYNFFSEKHGTIYKNRRRATEKLEYAMKYGTSLSGTFTVVKI